MSAPAPTPPEFILRDVVPREALDINRSIPFSSLPNTAASPFKVAGDQEAFHRAVECLATAIYYEAGTEPLDGRRAVAQVVLNRVRHPAFSPSVCGVIYQGSTRTTGCQFSFTCDGSQLRKPIASGWAEARAIAISALNGAVFKAVGYATHYHADYVVPYWASSLAKKTVVGRHIFYGWPASWGKGAAFTRRHAGLEPDPRVLRATAFVGTLHRNEVTIPPAAQTSRNPDARMELTRVIELLADMSTDSQSSPENSDLRRRFLRHSDHPAIQIYRQLSAADGQFKSKTFPEILMQYSEPPELAPLREPSGELIAAVGGRSNLLVFTSSLRDFATQSTFDTFLRDRHPRVSDCRSDRRDVPIANMDPTTRACLGASGKAPAA